jgi:hypothetical protein
MFAVAMMIMRMMSACNANLIGAQVMLARIRIHDHSKHP